MSDFQDEYRRIMPVRKEWEGDKKIRGIKDKIEDKQNEPVINAVYNLICGDVKVNDKQDLNDRVKKCVAELTELSHMWNEDEFLNETSIREILSKNKHLSEHVIKQVTNKSQGAVPIVEVLIHVIRWAGKGKDHFARDCIQLVSVLRLQLVQALKDDSVSLYNVVSMKNIRLKCSNDARFGVQVSFSTSLKDKDGMHDRHIWTIRIVR